MSAYRNLKTNKSDQLYLHILTAAALVWLILLDSHVWHYARVYCLWFNAWFSQLFFANQALFQAQYLLQSVVCWWIFLPDREKYTGAMLFCPGCAETKRNKTRDQLLILALLNFPHSNFSSLPKYFLSYFQCGNFHIAIIIFKCFT